MVVGDLGPHSQMLPWLSETALTGQYSAVLQLGGLSTYLSDANGTVSSATSPARTGLVAGWLGVKKTSFFSGTSLV